MNGKVELFPHLFIICLYFFCSMGGLVFSFYYRKDYLPYYVTKLLLFFLPICYSWQTFKQNPMLDIHGFLVTQIELYNSHSEDSPRPCFWQQGFGVFKLWIAM